ncbi:MAG: S8 family serine peptidase [Deltaproteobacteria bacterium]
MSTGAPLRAALTVALLGLWSGPSHASPPLATAARTLSPALRAELLGLPAGASSADVLFVRPGGVLGWARVPIDAASALAGTDGEISVGALRWPQIDRSAGEIHATAVRTRDGLTGRHVAIAVVDTGADVRHADLRRDDGSTRIAWLIDYSRPARGVHPDLEARFGMGASGGSLAGAVYSAADLDALLEQEARTGRRVDAIPVDEVGHGTYVASVAAGNGRASGFGLPAGRYVGMAPEADLLVVRANVSGTDRISDADVVAGLAFAVDRAQALGEPLVANLSIGSQYGTHDGNSALERAIAGLFPHDGRGRVVVAAAGNDGARAVHARVDLQRGFPLEIPLDLAPAPNSTDSVAVQIVYEHSASIAVRYPGGITTAWVDPGRARGFSTDEGLASVANATDEPAQTDPGRALDPSAPVHGAIVVLAGDAARSRLRAGGRWVLRLAGEGPVHVYLAVVGASRPRAQFAGSVLESGTVMVPATSRDVIAVGSRITRLDWPAWAAASGETPAQGDVSAFSARGPNRLNEPRPDLLAPGEWIVAAMSAQATPDVATSIFGMAPAGASRGLVADDGAHAAARGTSSAAPHVAGAIALLLEASPAATRDELQSALASTARAQVPDTAWDRASGWGEVTVDTALDALRGGRAAGAVDAARSDARATLGHATAGEPVHVMVRLLDAQGLAAEPGDSALPVVTATAGTVEDVRSLGHGLYDARWRATDGAAGAVTFAVRIGSRVLDAHPVVRVVRSAANQDAGVAAGNGCRVARGVPGRARCHAWLALRSVIAWGARLSRRDAQEAGKTGSGELFGDG